MGPGDPPSGAYGQLAAAQQAALRQQEALQRGYNQYNQYRNLFDYGLVNAFPLPAPTAPAAPPAPEPEPSHDPIEARFKGLIFED